MKASCRNLGDRVRVVKPTGTRHFVYDSQGRVVAEYGASSAEVKAEFIWAVPPGANDNAPFGGDDGIVGYAPLALVTTNTSSQLTLYWVHGNHLGVPIVTTNALGQVVDPGNDFLRPGFPGQSQVLSDLYYNRARDYDPVLGRYIQADPIGLLGGANPYLYANGDPVNFIDPWGLEPTYPTPHPSIPGGPWEPAGPGQRPGTFYGPKKPSGPRAQCNYVPSEAEGGMKGAEEPYWETRDLDGKKRYNLRGKLITAGQAHGHNRRPASSKKPWRWLSPPWVFCKFVGVCDPDPLY